MRKYLNILKNTDIFYGIPEQAILSIIQSGACYLKRYTAGVDIYECGTSISYAGIVLEGEIDVIHASSNGHESIVNRFFQGCLFGISYSCTETANTFNHFRSTTDATVLFINIRLILRERYSQCEHCLLLIENIMESLAANNIRLNHKIQVLSQHTLRKKILTYFELLADQNGSREFILPFNREQLASYLGSERSSLCRELSKLSEEKIIEVDKNRIVLLN